MLKYSIVLFNLHNKIILHYSSQTTSRVKDKIFSGSNSRSLVIFHVQNYLYLTNYFIFKVVDTSSKCLQFIKIIRNCMENKRGFPVLPDSALPFV